MKRESKLVIMVFLLVVGPAVLLSLFAVRVLNNWQVVLQNRLEAEAVRVLDQCVAAWVGESAGSGSATGAQFVVGRESESPWIDGIFIFKPGAGLVYPPAESTVSSFIPLDVVPDIALRAAALLQQAGALRAAGKTNEAVEVLREVARATPHPGPLPQGERVQKEPALLPLPLRERAGVRGIGEADNIPRDPDEGFYYDLIALKLLGDVEESRRRVLARYDDLVPLQRDLMVEFIEGSEEERTSNSQHSTSNIEQAKARDGSPFDVGSSMLTVRCSDSPLVAAWRERMRARALTAADRVSLAAEIAGVVASVPEKGWIRIRVAGKDALVGRGQPPTRVRSGAPGGATGVLGPESEKPEYYALQFSEGNLIDHLNVLFATATSNSSIRVVARSWSSLSHPASFILHASRLPAPLESIVLEATPADPQAFAANARLQTRLYAVGGGLLLISVVAGAWLIWRQAAGEIKEARERTEFAATVSHDLRTPLASMRMLAESLYMGNVADPAKRQTFLGAILKESDRLSRLTDRALYFIRYGQGALRYHFTEGDLASLVKDVVTTFAVGAGISVQYSVSRNPESERPASLVLHPVSELPQVYFDAGAVEQVVFNLLDNAVKYSTREKGIAIEVSLEARPSGRGLLRWRGRAGAEVVLSVKDHGVGMAADEVRRVLKPYVRGRGAPGRNARGLGLGLALCHHVVKAHGGRIEIESEVGKGTTFSIILPAAG